MDRKQTERQDQYRLVEVVTQDLRNEELYSLIEYLQRGLDPSELPGYNQIRNLLQLDGRTIHPDVLLLMSDVLDERTIQ